MSNPGLDCIAGRHLFYDIHDPDRITDDGAAVGFQPTFVARVPDGFHRDLGDVTW